MEYGYKKDCKYFEKDGRGTGKPSCKFGKSLGFGCTAQCAEYEVVEESQFSEIELAHEEEEQCPYQITSYHETPFELENKRELTGDPIYKDKVMKGYLYWTRFAGFLLSHVIRELRGIDLDAFQAAVGGKDSLELLRTEYSTSDTKTIRLDVVFEYDPLNVRNAEDMRLRINMEPQSTQEAHTEREDSYSLVARAIYYAAVALATELRSEESFHKLHKVYSVWICYERPVPDMREPIIRYSMQPDKDYRYADGITSIHTNKRKFDNGDLIGVILVSVPDIENAVRRGYTGSVDSYDLQELQELNILLSNDISKEERCNFFDKKNIDKVQLRNVNR